MKTISIYTLLSTLLLLATFSCKKDQVTPTETPQEPIETPEEPTDTVPEYNCTFEQNDEDMEGLIDDTERELMVTCNDNKLTSKSEIEANLIGEWELVGHGEGWVPRLSQPCSYITITEEELILQFENGYLDTLTTHTWEITAHNTGNFSLEFTPNDNAGIFINVFCEDYMYGDGTPLDGNMYLYQKVN